MFDHHPEPRAFSSFFVRQRHASAGGHVQDLPDSIAVDENGTLSTARASPTSTTSPSAANIPLTTVMLHGTP